MGMSSNLPPGITEGMLPGNRPEDAARERWLEEQVERGSAMVDVYEFPGPPDQLRALHACIEFVRVDVELGPALDKQLEDVQLALEERWSDA